MKQSSIDEIKRVELGDRMAYHRDNPTPSTKCKMGDTVIAVIDDDPPAVIHGKVTNKSSGLVEIEPSEMIGSWGTHVGKNHSKFMYVCDFEVREIV